jgi:hypothetical protein
VAVRTCPDRSVEHAVPLNPWLDCCTHTHSGFHPFTDINVTLSLPPLPTSDAEWKVLDGMTELLTTPGVLGAASFEYAGGWNSTFYGGSTGKKNERFTSPNAELASSLCPAGSSRNDSLCLDRLISRYEDDGVYTLHNFQLKLLSMGWEVYLIGTMSVRGNPRPMLIPVFGQWWDSWYELGLHWDLLEGHRWHWSDVLILKQGSPYRLEVLDRVFSATTQPSCVLELVTGR